MSSTTMRTMVPESRLYSTVFQLVEADTDSQLSAIEGMAVPYNVWGDATGWYLERMAYGGLDKSIGEGAVSLPLLLWHDSHAWPIGTSQKWTSTHKALTGRWALDGSEEAQRAGQMARDGMLTGMSIGFAPIRDEWQRVEDWDPLLGWDHMDRVTHVEARLLEVSLCPSPAMESARVSKVWTSVPKQRRAGGSTPLLDGWRAWRSSLDA